MRSSASATPAPSRASARAPSAGPSRGSRGPSQARFFESSSGGINHDGSPGFSQRNLYYLRSSPYTVLQMILYLDARHISWMNAPSDEANQLRSNGEVIMQKALAVLRGRIMDKLRRESGTNGRMGVVSRKEKVDIYASYDFQMAYFFRKMGDRHAVLLKDKSLIFPYSSDSVPVTAEPEAGNAPIPSTPERLSKRRRTEQEGVANEGSDLFISSETTAEGSGEAPTFVKRENEDDGAEALLRAAENSNGGNEEGIPASAMYDDELQTADDLLDEASRMKPQLRVKSYSGFRIFGKMLVVVIEPSKSVISSHPELFGAAPSPEVRQLSVTPMPGGAASRAGSRAGSRTQSRLTSVQPSNAVLGLASGSRNAREGSRRDSRAPSPGIGGTLFLGTTPTPEPESRRFGSRGVSRAMSATPGPAYTPVPRTRDGSPEGRTSDLAAAINQRSSRRMTKLPPVPKFFDTETTTPAAPSGATGEVDDDEVEPVQRRARDSQAPSPTPEPVVTTRVRAASIMPRRTPASGDSGSADAEGENEVDIGMHFDFGQATDANGEEDTLSDDEDETPTGFALATHMMEAGGQAGQRGTDVDYAE